jgi:VCBS repeat-containing protein
MLSAGGALTFSDADLTDTHIATVTKASGTMGGTLSTLVSDNGDGTGTVNWTYEVANANAQSLYEGETASERFNLEVSDGQGGSDTEFITLTLTGVNDAPAITSDGGGDSVDLFVAEHTTAVTDVDALDVDHDYMLTFSIVGGADSEQFTIDWETGALRFLFAPDFELPNDVDGNNVYDVVVEVKDEYDATDIQSFAVNVTDTLMASGATGDLIL